MFILGLLLIVIGAACHCLPVALLGLLIALVHLP
jgi:hypothetical protein